MKQQELTYKELEDLQKSGKYEVFKSAQIEAWRKDGLQKQKEGQLTEEEQMIFAYENTLFKSVLVRNKNLSTETVYIRETQLEKVQNESEGDIQKSEGYIFKCTPLNIMKGIAELRTDDTEGIEKARKGEPVGTEKTWGGKSYIKTANGWRPKKSNTNNTPKPEKLKVGDTFPEKISTGDTIRVKIKGKEYAIQHQYDKDDQYGRFRIFTNNKQIGIVDYGAGAKFHGYDFDKSDRAYNGVKNFILTGKKK